MENGISTPFTIHASPMCLRIESKTNAGLVEICMPNHEYLQ